MSDCPLWDTNSIVWQLMFRYTDSSMSSVGSRTNFVLFILVASSYAPLIEYTVYQCACVCVFLFAVNRSLILHQCHTFALQLAWVCLFVNHNLKSHHCPLFNDSIGSTVTIYHSVYSDNSYHALVVFCWSTDCRSTFNMATSLPDPIEDVSNEHLQALLAERQAELERTATLARHSSI